MEGKRSSFTGKIGFVLAAAGSAVGLALILGLWRLERYISCRAFYFGYVRFPRQQYPYADSCAFNLLVRGLRYKT